MDNEYLSSALDRAKAFAATMRTGDTIDEASGFTADNLLALIAAAEPPTAEDDVIDKLGDLA